MELEEIIQNINLRLTAIEKHLNVFTEEEKEDYHYMINNLEVLIMKARKNKQ
ncbi:MAG: hypothetical protein IJ272_09385 [Clostridia bacterium]|nr:hypothetical protein [Clostridia bacterium]